VAITEPEAEWIQSVWQQCRWSWYATMAKVCEVNNGNGTDQRSVVLRLSGALEIYVGGFWKRIPRRITGDRRSASCSTPANTVRDAVRTKGRAGQWQWQCWGG
jgi:hypothetical protein